MEHKLDLNPRPFESIKKGIKKIEGRTPVNEDSNIDFSSWSVGDTIIFTNNENKDKLKVIILGVRHYRNVKIMLETEGTRNVLSSQGTLKEGIKSYNNLENYNKGIKKFGIFAIEFKKL